MKVVVMVLISTVIVLVKVVVVWLSPYLLSYWWKW